MELRAAEATARRLDIGEWRKLARPSQGPRNLGVMFFVHVTGEVIKIIAYTVMSRFGSSYLFRVLPKWF